MTPLFVNVHLVDAELSLEMYSRGPRSWDVWREAKVGVGWGYI